MTSRPSGGPAAKPGGLKPQQGFDQNARMAKPSTAGNAPAARVVPNMHQQPKLQGILAARKMAGK